MRHRPPNSASPIHVGHPADPGKDPTKVGPRKRCRVRRTGLSGRNDHGQLERDVAEVDDRRRKQTFSRFSDALGQIDLTRLGDGVGELTPSQAAGTKPPGDLCANTLSWPPWASWSGKSVS